MESVKYFSIMKRLFLLSGFWPHQEKRTRLFRVSMMTVIALSLMAPQTIYNLAKFKIGKLLQCDGNGRCIMITIPSMMVVFTILVKMYTCHLNSDKIKILIDHLREDWTKLESVEEYEIMQTYAANAKLYSLVYIVFFYGAAGSFVLFSLIPHILDVVLPLNESRPMILPYESYYYVDTEKYFFYIFFHVLISIEILMTTVLAHDCMLLIFIEHICGLFAVTGFRFEILSRNANVVNNIPKVYDRKIASSVYAHWRALVFATLFEETFYVSFAVQIIMIVVGLSISLVQLQITLQLNGAMEIIRYSALVVAQLLHLFCYSFQGQKLIDYSMQIRDKVYNSSWYEIPARSQKLFLHVIHRSLQPNFLSAGKIYVFSLKNFTTVLQSSMSYFTVLASFQ